MLQSIKLTDEKYGKLFKIVTISKWSWNVFNYKFFHFNWRVYRFFFANVSSDDSFGLLTKSRVTIHLDYQTKKISSAVQISRIWWHQVKINYIYSIFAFKYFWIKNKVIKLWMKIAISERTLNGNLIRLSCNIWNRQVQVPTMNDAI